MHEFTVDFSKIIMVMQYSSLGWVKTYISLVSLQGWVKLENSFSSAPTPAIKNDRSLTSNDEREDTNRMTNI